MRYCILLATTAVLLACATRAEAGRFFCHHCGCCQNCKKVCRLKCEKKKETTTEYTCECEDFCIPGPSKKCGVKTQCACDGHHRAILWQPTCARVHTRKKLVKKEVTKEVPDYKWVVEEYCCACGHWVKVERDKDKDKQDKEGGPEKSDKAGSGSTKNEKSKAAGSEAGDSNIERLPLPPAVPGDPQARRNPPPANYRADYLGAESDAVLELTTVADLELIEAETEPRRQFFGFFSR